jgi:hypothetical protein
MTVFTSPGTFTTPASTTKIKVTVIGGGGNAFASPAPTSPNRAGGGGGGGAIFVGPVAASSPFAVTVGGVAETSSFGPIVSATGGSNATSGAFGPGGVGSGGTINLNGNPGAPNVFGASGGNSALAFGYASQAPTASAVGYGAGGSFGSPSPTTPNAGTAGVVIVEY